MERESTTTSEQDALLIKLRDAIDDYLNNKRYAEGLTKVIEYAEKVSREQESLSGAVQD